jgi:hypothetical protein
MWLCRKSKAAAPVVAKASTKKGKSCCSFLNMWVVLTLTLPVALGLLLVCQHFELVEGDPVENLKILQLALEATGDCLLCWVAVLALLGRPTLTLLDFLGQHAAVHGAVLLKYAAQIGWYSFLHTRTFLMEADAWTLFWTFGPIVLVLLLYLLQRCIVRRRN